MTEAQFLADLLARRLFVHRGEAADRFGGLLSWEQLRCVLASGVIPRGKLRVTQGRRTVSPLVYSDEGRPSLPRLDLLMKHGASLVVTRLADCVPAVAELTGYLTGLTGERVSAGAIVTTGSGGALPPHFDAKDIVILQVEGSKHWKIWEAHVCNPVMGMDTNRPPPDGQRLVFDDELRPGDLLFLPAGCWHQCENGSGRSLHLGIFLEPLTALHALLALVDRLREDKAFRLPLTRAGDPRGRIEAELKDRLHRLADGLSVDELIATLQAGRYPDDDDD